MLLSKTNHLTRDCRGANTEGWICTVCYVIISLTIIESLFTMQISLKDPVYGLAAWQGEVNDLELLPELMQQAIEQQKVWQSKTFDERKKVIRSWQRVLLRNLPIEIKPLRATTGLSTSQIEEDMTHWQKKSLTDTPVNVFDEHLPAAVLLDTADFSVLENVMQLLVSGFAAIVFVPDFLVPSLEVFKQHWPDVESRNLFQVVAVSDWTDLDLSQLNLACCHFYGSIAGAHDVHKSLAGHFKLPTHFEVVSDESQTVSTEIKDAELLSILKAAFHHSGQSIANTKRINVKEADLAGIKKRIAQNIKSIKVAAFDANPSPFMSSLISKKAAKAVYDAYQVRAKTADIVVPMKRLMGQTGMLTASVLVLTPEQAKQYQEPIAGPVLEIVVS